MKIGENEVEGCKNPEFRGIRGAKTQNVQNTIYIRNIYRYIGSESIETFGFMKIQ